MQSALGVQDLGQFHYQPLRDSEGTTVLCTCRKIHDPKLISSLSVRWMPLGKLLRKLYPSAGSSPENSDSSLGFTLAGELLLQSLTVRVEAKALLRLTRHYPELIIFIFLLLFQDMINYNRNSCRMLPRGLYLGYVKLKSSVDMIKVLVPQRTPNVLPNIRVRENPHVSREEWDYLRTVIGSGGGPPPSLLLSSSSGSAVDQTTSRSNLLSPRPSLSGSTNSTNFFSHHQRHDSGSQISLNVSHASDDDALSQSSVININSGSTQATPTTPSATTGGLGDRGSRKDSSKSGSTLSLNPPSHLQYKFLKSIATAARVLLRGLDVSDDDAPHHRIYDFEVVELGPNVSMILVLPPLESVCIVPGQSNLITDKPGFALLPLQIFELSKQDPPNKTLSRPRLSSRICICPHRYRSYIAWIIKHESSSSFLLSFLSLSLSTIIIR